VGLAGGCATALESIKAFTLFELSYHQLKISSKSYEVIGLFRFLSPKQEAHPYPRT
jgi:hypothetical protein